MSDFTTDTETKQKRVVMLQHVGPAFDLREIERAHAELDLAGIPREIDGISLSISGRIAYMHGELMVYRSLVGDRQ